jgi:RHS repeat-associated protein
MPHGICLRRATPHRWPTTLVRSCSLVLLTSADQVNVVTIGFEQARKMTVLILRIGKRFAPTHLVLGSADHRYNYTTGQNNGQVSSTVISGEQVNYTYDSLKRLAEARESNGAWGQGYVYDGFGNLTQKTMTAGSGVPTIQLQVDAATNRLVQSGGSYFSYDANGNVLSGPTVPSGGSGLHYDWRNRVSATGSVTSYTGYAYDAGNRRVWKGSYDGSGQLSAETYYLYDLGGVQLGSYTLQITETNGTQSLQLQAVSNHFYFAGKHVAERTGTGSYTSVAAPDRLGSEMSYYPYGDEKGTVTAQERVKYATYWRDGESGLDYARNRYYSSAMGRFLSADPYKAKASATTDTTNPASWSRYGYVLNDPINFYDPKGRQADTPGIGSGSGDDGGQGSGDDPDPSDDENGDADPAWPDPGSPTPPPPPVPKPQCTIKVYDRPIENPVGSLVHMPGALHGYILFLDMYGQNVYYAEGQHQGKLLQAYVGLGEGALPGEIPTKNHLDGSRSGLDVCFWLGSLKRDAEWINDLDIPYRWRGPNSNSVLSYMLNSLPDTSWFNMPFMVGYGTRLVGSGHGNSGGCRGRVGRWDL